MLNKKFISRKVKFLDFLNKSGIETRPIISGNFINQKSVKLYNLNPNKAKFKGAQEIEDRGFFIGIHTDLITDKKLSFIREKLLKIDEI